MFELQGANGGHTVHGDADQFTADPVVSPQLTEQFEQFDSLGFGFGFDFIAQSGKTAGAGLKGRIALFKVAIDLRQIVELIAFQQFALTRERVAQRFQQMQQRSFLAHDRKRSVLGLTLLTYRLQGIFDQRMGQAFVVDLECTGLDPLLQRDQQLVVAELGARDDCSQGAGRDVRHLDADCRTRCYRFGGGSGSAGIGQVVDATITFH